MVDPPLKTWIFSHPDVVAIEYHTWFPYAGDPFYLANTQEVMNRVFYYEISSAPSIRMDGPYAPASFNPTAYENLYLQRKAVPSRVQLDLQGDYDPDLRTGTLTVQATAEESMPGDWRLRVAITESDIHYQAPNGINVHEHVFRRFLPDTTGTALSFPGPYPDTQMVDLPFTLDPGWAHENVHLVVFLQEQGSRAIEQAGAIGAFELVTAVDDENGSAVGVRDRIAAVRPNPFNPQTRIDYQLASPGHVVLTVHNPAGRLVRTLVSTTSAAGRHAVDWDGRDNGGRPLPAGVYLMRLEGPTATSQFKAVLLR